MHQYQCWKRSLKTGPEFGVILWVLLAFIFIQPSAAQSDRLAEAKEPTTVSTECIDPAKQVDRFLTQYCLDCHDKDASEGEREFESFRFPLSSVSQLITADEIIDQVTLKEMPPADSDQPSDRQRLEVLDALRSEIALARERIQSTGARTVLRRLSHREYENTLATLFNRRVDTLGLTAEFPKENTSGHMDNIGDTLVTSGFLLDQYFLAANRLVESRLGKPDTKPQSWHFTDNFVQYEELTGAHRSVFNFEFLCLYEQPNTDTRQGGYGHIEDFLDGVPVSGLYDIEVNAQAMHRDTHYDSDIFAIDFSEPFQIAVVPGDASKGHIHYPQAIEPILASSIVPDEQPEWLKFRVWLDAGQTPRFIFPNGPYESRASVIKVNQRYKDEFGFDNPKGVQRAHILRKGELPHIKIGEIKIVGPIQEKGGGKEEVAIFGKRGFQKDQALVQLNDFARRAFRRPLEEGDKSRIQSMYNKRISEEASPRQAALDTIKLILCSPSFLYLSEITNEDSDELNAYDLASRLSYTLWAAPPDRKLFAAAKSGKLKKEKHFKRQIRRMLDDPSSEQFVSGFLDAWLNLRDIGNLPPPRTSARSYYTENLPESMKEEARAFFRHLLVSNGSVLDLLDADYTFVDKKLAKLYRLPEQESLRLADGFQKVSLDDFPQRGGVLGMAGVLTVSANGVDTSPVTRGVWVMENILGVTPPTPPDEVPEIEADVSGSKTIREKLARHSQDQTCNVCHRKIDPLGFALETFDPIGRWREKYPKPNGKGSAQKIDPSGELSSGESYSGFSDFKTALMKSRKDHFARHLVEKLLSYSIGRRLERVDQYEVEDILKQVQTADYGLRTLVVQTLSSQVFRNP